MHRISLMVCALQAAAGEQKVRSSHEQSCHLLVTEWCQPQGAFLQPQPLSLLRWALAFVALECDLQEQRNIKLPLLVSE